VVSSVRIKLLLMVVRSIAFLILAALLGMWLRLSSYAQEPTKKPAGDQACESCHAQIAKSYAATGMAGASGPASDGVTPGEFVHKLTDTQYHVYEKDGSVWMSYERGGKDGIRGERELEYFIGSGKKGRMYLFAKEGFWFQAPIYWHSEEKRWNMIPAYAGATEIPLNLPAYVSCLNCHTSGMQPPEPGTDNKFQGKPFLHAGITCERCHGQDVGHATGTGTVVNPAKLPAERRDGICMQCHLEDAISVPQPGKQGYEFQPGERLSDYVHYFVLATSQEQPARGLTQFEALSLSVCKKKSGDKMWCGSCHDSHSEPAPAEKAAFYRGKCIACHGDAFAAKHHPEKPDCTSCHMPSLPSRDVAHTEATDHRILRYMNTAPLPQLLLRNKPLLSFPAINDGLATTRDFALAWETLVQRGSEGAPRQAEQYLKKAVLESPDDPVLLADLGFLEQEQKHDDAARDLYQRALKIDPLANDAAMNLGVLEARRGNLARAVELWQGAFARVPDRSAIGMNLAIAFCADKQTEVARKFVHRVLEFNPDYGKAKSLLENLSKDPVQCKP
jgi:tetratricopeptide repeat protein/cytochrome c554/c'-like protein